jgi:hypothetical protein
MVEIVRTMLINFLMPLHELRDNFITFAFRKQEQKYSIMATYQINKNRKIEF